MKTVIIRVQLGLKQLTMILTHFEFFTEYFFCKLKSEALQCVEFHKWLRLLILRRILSRGGSRIFVELLYESNKLITLVFQNHFKNLF